MQKCENIDLFFEHLQINLYVILVSTEDGYFAVNSA